MKHIKLFEQFVNESFELNESFKSSKLASLFTNSRGKIDKELAGAFYRMAQIKMDQVEDYDIIEMDPKAAYKDKRESAVYFYFTRNAKDNPYTNSEWESDKVIPANTLLAITNGKNEFYGMQWQKWSNDKGYKLALDSGSSYRASKSVGVDRSRSKYGGTGLSNVKRVSDVADAAYVLDLAILNNRYDTSDLRNARKTAKQGAIAFQNDKEFKQENLRRYNEIIANRAAKMPIDKMVADSIDALSTQIKDGIAKGETTRYGDIIVGMSSKGRGVKISDVGYHMQRILNDFEKYVSLTNEAEAEKKAGDYDEIGGRYYEKRIKEYAKSITDKIKQIKNFDYA